MVLWTMLALGVTLALAGCGGNGDSGGGPKIGKRGAGGDDDMGGGGGLKGRKNASGDDSDSGGGGGGGKKGGAPPPGPPAGGSPPPGSSGPPGAPGMPGGPGAPGGAPAAGAGAVAPVGATDLALGPASFPTREHDPFQPLDKPLKPAPPQAGPVERSLLVPFRPQLILPPPEHAAAQAPVEPADLRVAGYGRAGEAVLEQGDNNITVRPGQVITIQFNGPRQVKVISITPDGVILKDTQSGQLYHAPNTARGR
jgi:hypothetical protein